MIGYLAKQTANAFIGAVCLTAVLGAIQWATILHYKRAER